MQRITTVDGLSDELFAHLDDEMSLLTSILHFLQNVRGFFLRSDAEGLAEFLEGEREINIDAASLKARREQIRKTLGSLHTEKRPQSPITLSEVIQHADGELKLRLQDYRQRLLHVTDQIESLSRGNIALAAHSIELLNQVLREITGGDVLDRYSPTGQLQHAAGRPAYQARV